MKQALLLTLALAMPAGLFSQQASRPASQHVNRSASEQASRPAITGVAFARFYTTDLAAAQHFYGSTLGFDGRQSDGKWIYPVNRSQWLEIVPATPPHANLRMAAVGFTTRDAAGLQKYLAGRGVAIEQPLQDGEFAVRDPEGNLIYFVQSDSHSMVAHSSPSPNAVSRRIIHVGFMIQDQAKEDAFWQGILGFHPYWHGGHTDNALDWAMVQVPDGSDWLEYMFNAGPSPTLQKAGVDDHFSLGVDHINDLVATLARNHCEGERCTKTVTGRDGKVQLGLFDPDLTRAEIMEFKPVVEPCCSPFTGKQPTDEEDR
jgi:catechol 2,3-dioxygenase-like lactoylglutathione lyase family enzyme